MLRVYQAFSRCNHHSDALEMTTSLVKEKMGFPHLMVPRIIFTPAFISARCYKELDITDSILILSWYVVRVGSKRIYIEESGPGDPIKLLLKKHL